MAYRKKILLWSSGVAGLAAVLFFVAIVLAPMYLASLGVKNKIQAAASEKLGGKVSYERIDLSLLPRPHVIVTQLHLAYPRTFSGTLHSLTVYPRLFPLFRRQLRLSRIRALEPDFRIVLPAVVSESARRSRLWRKQRRISAPCLDTCRRSAPVLSLKLTEADSYSEEAAGIYSPFET